MFIPIHHLNSFVFLIHWIVCSFTDTLRLFLDVWKTNNNNCKKQHMKDTQTSGRISSCELLLTN